MREQEAVLRVLALAECYSPAPRLPARMEDKAETLTAARRKVMRRTRSTQAHELVSKDPPDWVSAPRRSGDWAISLCSFERVRTQRLSPDSGDCSRPAGGEYPEGRHSWVMTPALTGVP